MDLQDTSGFRLGWDGLLAETSLGTMTSQKEASFRKEKFLDGNRTTELLNEGTRIPARLGVRHEGQQEEHACGEGQGKLQREPGATAAAGRPRDRVEASPFTC